MLGVLRIFGNLVGSPSFGQVSSATSLEQILSLVSARRHIVTQGESITEITMSSIIESKLYPGFIKKRERRVAVREAKKEIFELVRLM